MQVFNANGIAIHHDSNMPHNGRPTIVFLNSLGTDFRMWDGVRTALDGRFNNIVLDKRGHGLSSVSATPPSIATFAEDTERLISHLGARNIVLCGISVGGLIAQHLMLHSKLDIKAAILSNTGLKIGDAEMWNARISAVRQDSLEGIADNVIQRWLSAEWRAAHPDLTMLYRNMLARTTQAGYLAVCQAIRDNPAFHHPAGAVPALCISGAHDVSTPPALVRAMSSAITGSRYHEFTTCGHLPCIEQPDAYAKLVSDFVDGLE